MKAKISKTAFADFSKKKMVHSIGIFKFTSIRNFIFRLFVIAMIMGLLICIAAYAIDIITCYKHSAFTSVGAVLGISLFGGGAIVAFIMDFIID
ncbi:MAG: hypothetical protein V1928_02595 [Parcubacteria group bacterium]